MKASERSAQIAAIAGRVEALEAAMKFLTEPYGNAENFAAELQRVAKVADSLMDARAGDKLHDAAKAWNAKPDSEEWGSGWAWMGAILALGAAGLAVYECNQRKERARQRLLSAPTADYEVTR